MLDQLVMLLALATSATYAEAPAAPPSPDGTASSRSVSAATEEPAEEPRIAETLVVTASRIEEPILEAPVSITVIDSRDLEVAPSESYADLLRQVPGLNAVQLSARDSQFAARTATGVMSNRMLVLVDGRSIYLDHQGIVMFDGLSFGTDEIEQIEILKGPGSSMWGANALAGVVNLRTRPPSELAGGTFEAEFGENGFRRLGARWAGPAGERTDYKISASYLEQDPWPRDPLTSSGVPVPNEFGFLNEGTAQPKLDVRVDHRPNERSTWSYRAGYAGVEGIILSGLGPLSLRDDFLHAYGEVRRTGPRHQATVYWNRMQGDTVNLISGDTLVSRTDTLVGEWSGHLEPGDRHRIVYGANARHGEFALSWTEGEDSRDEAGAFVEDEIHLGDLVKIAVGARVDHFDTIGTTLSPRATLFVAPRWNHVFRLSYNRAYRSPTHIESYMDVTTSNPVVLDPALPLFDLRVQGRGDPDLDEESIHAIELGYSAILGGRHELAAAVYRNEIDDSIEFATTAVYGPGDPPPGWPFPPEFTPPLPKVFSPFNAGTVREQGIELSLKTDWSPTWRTQVAYSYQDDPELDPADSPFPVALNSPPNHQASVRVSASLERWSGTVGISYTDDAVWRDVLDERFWGPTDDYLLVDGNLTWELAPAFALTLRGTNLFDEEAKQHAFGDIIGRQVSLRLRYRWSPRR